MLFLLITEKEMHKKIAAEILRFVGVVFLIIEKGRNNKIAPEILRLASMLF